MMTRRNLLAASALAMGGTVLKADSLGFDGAVDWLNSGPLKLSALRGKVVLVNFWTYSCINSLRPLPYLKTWAARYRDAGLAVVGVHTPEFEFEKQRANVQRAVNDLKIAYPVPMDSGYRIWRTFENNYWPAFYILDAKGRSRYQHFGEGDYDQCEREIRSLLKENGSAGIPEPVPIGGVGIEAPPGDDVRTPETYVGYRNAERFHSPERMGRDSRRTYSAPTKLAVNEWGLSGSWNVGAESGALAAAPGKIIFRFHSRDLHLVAGPGDRGEPARFKVTLDGAEPSVDAGVDTAPDGGGMVREPRLYQLVRQKGLIKDRTFAIEFLDPGAHAFAFTFG
ncbi:MAG: redoxin domain-containing protein [Acidobacteriota bacterium]